MVQATSAGLHGVPKEDLLDLVEALRGVMMAGRRKAAGSEHDKSVFALLSQLMTAGSLRASELAERACLDLSTVSRHISALESNGYVSRTPDPDDGRATLLAVTKAGQKLVRETREQRLTMVASALKDWSDADRADLIRLTRRLAESLENL
ncbi:MAG TPA: MarR family transcriptional regulator [Actinomycetes bacterium]|nr:MarR family transcriptional regulator [Actinomycetes bacterium]